MSFLMSDGKRFDCKLMGDLIFIKKMVMRRGFGLRRNCEVWCYVGKFNSFDKGRSSNGEWIIFDF